jgi:hypothetical protein
MRRAGTGVSRDELSLWGSSFKILGATVYNITDTFYVSMYFKMDHV